MKILHVEDTPEICQLYQDFLGILNHNVESVTDGREGLKRLMKNDYDSILLDIAMPSYDGFHFLEDLKRIKPSELKKVTVVSQLDFNDEQLEKFKEYGVNSIQKKTLDLIKYETSGQLEIKRDISCLNKPIVK